VGYQLHVREVVKIGRTNASEHKKLLGKIQSATDKAKARGLSVGEKQRVVCAKLKRIFKKERVTGQKLEAPPAKRPAVGSARAARPPAGRPAARSSAVSSASPAVRGVSGDAFVPVVEQQCVAPSANMSKRQAKKQRRVASGAAASTKPAQKLEASPATRHCAEGAVSSAPATPPEIHAKALRAAAGWTRMESRTRPGNFYYFHRATSEYRMDPPDPWLVCKSKTCGKAYYFNPVTNITVWEKPEV